MRTLAPLLLCLFFNSSVLFSQTLSPNSQTQKAMEKLSFLEGKWLGEGMLSLDEEGEEFTQLQEVYYKMNRSVMILEGRGYAKGESDRILHKALAIISYDSQDQRYVMRAYRSDGSLVDAEIYSIEENEISWGFSDERTGVIRYQITLNNNRWRGISEVSQDGLSWFTFLEMDLQKRSDL